MDSEDIMKRYLKRIERFFDTEKIINENISLEYIKNYYRSSILAYKVLHTFRGYMHMGISFDGKYKVSDLLTSVKIVEEYINSRKISRVLELASGNGVNSSYIASRNPGLDIIGIDLSTNPKKNVNGYRHINGDFHNLSVFPDKSFDLIFIIEAFCHSQNKEKVLEQCFNKLKKHGLFVIFDGYSRKSKLSDKDMKTSALISKSMAVDRFISLKEFKTLVKEFNFKIIEEKDFSLNVLPNAERFRKISNVYFSSYLFHKVLTKIFPMIELQNLIALNLLSLSVKNNLLCYYMHVLEKN